MARGNLSRAQAAVAKRLVGLLLLLRNPRTGLPEELPKKAEEELAHVAAVGSNEENVMADDKLNRASQTAAGST